MTMKDSIKSIIVSILFGFGVLCSLTISAQKSIEDTYWLAPQSAEELVNPIKDEEAALKLGKKIYTNECVVCHGKYGNAETDIAKNLEQKPKNFTQEGFSTQSDGAIFWKLSEGRGLMQPFKTMLTEEEIWSVVIYVRKLAQAED